MTDWRYPDHLVYSYYKTKGGWYPHYLGGWTRGPSCIKIYLDRDDAIVACPPDCKVVLMEIQFRYWRDI